MPPVQEVVVRFNPDRYVEDTAGHREAVLPSYTVAIPLPGHSSPVMVTALRPDNTATGDDGSYVDPLVQQAVDDGYQFHRIVDESGKTVTVMMTESDWNAYQSSLASFAAAAAASPTLYHPTAASQPFGLFRPQVQAGGGSPSMGVFRPMSEAQMRNSGISGESFSTGGGTNLDMMMYSATNDAQRSALRNAGYVEIRVDDPETPGGTVPRFVSPMDARIFGSIARGTPTTRFPMWPL